MVHSIFITFPEVAVRASCDYKALFVFQMFETTNIVSSFKFLINKQTDFELKWLKHMRTVLCVFLVLHI